MCCIWEKEQHNRLGQYRTGEMMSSTLYQVQTRVGIELDSYQDWGFIRTGRVQGWPDHASCSSGVGIGM